MTIRRKFFMRIKPSKPSVVMSSQNPILGHMQPQSLTVASLLRHAARNHPKAEIVSRRVEGDIHRTCWSDVAARASRIASWLDAAGLNMGDRVATLAWNGYRHLELYFGVSASGRVLHTLNPRLSPEQLTWIINDAQDRIVCYESSFAHLIKTIRLNCPLVEHWVELADVRPGETTYESILQSHPATDDKWPDLQAHQPCSLCYTSGTTGHPKGVLYSHLSTVLHAYAVALPDSLGLSAKGCVLPVVPMFHVNAWGLPYAAALTGIKLVLPGPALDGKSVYELIEAEGVELAAGVPTVWQMLLNYVDQNGLRFTTLKRSVIGGAACPPSMIDRFRDAHGIDTIHAWGMTELSPLGTVNTLTRAQLSLPESEQRAVRTKQGRPVFGVELRLESPEGKDVPFDGVSTGELLVRGPWVVGRYWNQAEDVSPDGWFRTGDIASIDGDGFMQITDRVKDIIKSGGEWISSIDIENLALQASGVAAAACIGVPHPRWDERPLLLIVKKADALLDAQDVLDFLRERLPRWQVPDAIEFVESLPVGGTGKYLKHKLRDQYSGFFSSEGQQGRSDERNV